MEQSQSENIALEIIGQSIAGIVCDRFYRLDDALVVLDAQGNSKVIDFSSRLGEVRLYTIEDQEIEKVRVIHNAKVFLFYTMDKVFLVNDQNEVLESSNDWNDFYFDELSNRFYRKDIYGHWYDIEGLRMQEHVFLIGDVLSSLDKKRSKQSLSFRGQEIYISANKQLIQLGKLVLDLELEVVKYFGEKVTGLGVVTVAFDGADVLQEVKLGLEETAFINEFTREPYLLGDTKVSQHLGTYLYGKKRVVIFKVLDRTFGVIGSSENFLNYNNRPLQLRVGSHISFNESELIKVNDGIHDFYFDLNNNVPFELNGIDYKRLSDIEALHVRVENDRVFNVFNASEQFCVREQDGSIFRLDDGQITPQRIDDVEGLNKYFAYATVDGQQRLFSKKQSKILKFGKDALEVAKLVYVPTDKFINALDTNGNKLVLDIRYGFENISLAEANGDKITEYYGSTMPMGNKVLLNVHIDQLGGTVRRVVNLNEGALSYFTLPAGLKQVSGQEIASVFASNAICQIHYSKVIDIEERAFVTADFLDFSGEEHSVILEKKTGIPLHLEGVGHRNELATTWVDYSLHKPIYLGGNRMVGVNTLRENQKESSLLFSIQQMTSWLPFYNNYLPILKQVVYVSDKLNDTWNYHLLELAEVSKDKEYIVVEKTPPYRLLAYKISGSYEPRVVKSKIKSISSPLELNTLKRLFYLDFSTLVDIE